MVNDENSGLKNDGTADYKGSRFISAAQIMLIIHYTPNFQLQGRSNWMFILFPTDHKMWCVSGFYFFLQC